VTCAVCGSPREPRARFCSACGTRFKEHVDKYHGFISYRRETGSHFATLLKVVLEETLGLPFFLDVDELQVGRFDERLLDIIGNTPNFLLILSPGCLDRCVEKSDWLKREIVHALETSRNVVPILLEGFQFPGPNAIDLLPEAMRVLPNLQAVTYSHVHRESSVRKIAEYCVEAVVPNIAPTGHTADPEWLLTVRHEIQNLFQNAVSDTDFVVDGRFTNVLPATLLALNEQWNNSHIVVDMDVLKQNAEAILGSTITPTEWTSVTRSLTVRTPGDTSFSGLLLFTPKAGQFAVNYPKLSEYWTSNTGRAMQTLLGIAPKLRPPTSQGEVQWVDWTRNLDGQADKTGSQQGPAALQHRTIEEVYSKQDREKVEAGMKSISALPESLRRTVASHIGKLISEKRTALAAIRDEPGNAEAYVHLGTLYFWDGIRVVESCDQEGLQRARAAIWTTADQGPIRGYFAIAMYCLQHYLAIQPNGVLRQEAERVLADMRSLAAQAGQAPSAAQKG